MLVRFENWSGQRVGIYQSKSNAISLYNTMPAECLVTVVKRNKHDSQGELRYQKNDQFRGTVRLIRLKENPNTAQKRLDRQILKITREVT